MIMFKVGDKVRIIDTQIPKIGIIYAVHPGLYQHRNLYSINLTDNFGNYTDRNLYYDTQLELIADNKDTIKNMNIKEKFILAITSEPKKSFRKAGITDGDDILTEEGCRVFLTWLLHNKYSEEFKKDVVDGILEEEKSKN